VVTLKIKNNLIFQQHEMSEGTSIDMIDKTLIMDMDEN